MGFDEEQRDWVRQVMRRAGLAGTSHEVERLMTSISLTMEVWEAARAGEAPFREQHDALREIWRMVDADDPPVGQIRARLEALPAAARDYLLRRARALWPKAMARKSLCDLAGWARRAPRRRLLSRLRSTILQGGSIVEGRRRGDDKQSAGRFEPVIMGVARGSGLQAPRGGRPSAADTMRLVAYLGVDWALATGKMPERGRSAEQPFSDLVHHVFEWLGVGAADQALRRYWQAFEEGRAKPSAPGPAEME
jgi:hypothetical protein